MTLKTSKLAGTVILCSIALSACAPIQKRIVKIIPGNAQTATVVTQEVAGPAQQPRVVRRVAPPTRQTSQPAAPRPVAISAPSAPAATPVIPVAAKVTPAKKDCSIGGTPGCPVTRTFGFNGGDGDGGNDGGGGGWDG